MKFMKKLSKQQKILDYWILDFWQNYKFGLICRRRRMCVAESDEDEDIDATQDEEWQ